jgi:hypothetical protein
MSDTQDDPLLGLLTDTAEGVATLVARVDAMEAAITVHQAQVNEALATIAEIATRTYYASKPPNALPDDVVNSGVMDAMIERWPREAPMAFSGAVLKLLQNLDAAKTGEIDAMLRSLAVIEALPTNTARIRQAFALAILNGEMNKRAEAQRQLLEREAKRQGR